MGNFARTASPTGIVLVLGVFHGPLMKRASSWLDFYFFFGEQPPGDLPQ